MRLSSCRRDDTRRDRGFVACIAKEEAATCSWVASVVSNEAALASGDRWLVVVSYEDWPLIYGFSYFAMNYE